MKKIILILTAFVMVMALGFATGCSAYIPGGLNDDDFVFDMQIDGIDPNMAGSLTVSVPNTAAHLRAINSFIESFNKSYKNIVIKVETIEMDSYKSALSLQASAAVNDPSKMSDVFWLSQEYVNDFYDLKVLGPLENIIKNDSSFYKSRLTEKSVLSSSVMTEDGKNKMYLMPRDYNQVVMYYNKDMFDAAKVAYPKDGMTGKEFVDMLKNLRTGLVETDAKNAYGNAYKEYVSSIVDCNVKWDSMAWPLIKSFGGEVVDSSGEVVYDSPETAEAIGFWKDLIRDKADGITLSVDLTAGATKVGQRFNMQEAPILLHSRALLSELVTDSEEFGNKFYGINVGAAAIPNFGGEYAIGGGCSGYSMYKYTKHATEAWLFLKHVVSTAGQEAYSETGDCVPVLKTLLADEGAVWRNCLGDKLGNNFNHEAFIYRMDEVFASTRDFYVNVPFKAQANIKSRIEESFDGAVNGTQADPIGDAIRAAALSMKNDILVANKEKQK